MEIPEAAPDQEMEANAQEVNATDAAAEPEAPTPPLEPAIVAHPKPAMQGGQPSCSNLSLCTLLEYRRQREKLSFEVGSPLPGGRHQAKLVCGFLFYCG